MLKRLFSLEKKYVLLIILIVLLPSLFNLAEKNEWLYWTLIALALILVVNGIFQAWKRK